MAVPSLPEGSADAERHASWIELFFDLVFVLAVAQLSDGFREDPTVTGAVKLVALFVPVWWAWVGLVFYATRFPSDGLAFRVLVFAAMAASLALAVALPRAFEGETVGFALSYAAVRAVLVLLYVRSHSTASLAERSLITALATGFGVGAALWLVSIAVPTPARYAVWALALAVDLGAPALRGGRLAVVPIDASHLPERFGLFVIIVLGEAVATTGQGLSHVDLSTEVLLRAVACFVVACAIWWAYFDRAETLLRSDVERSDTSGTFARDVYSYAHFPIVVGITFAAAGARLLIGEEAGDAGARALCLGTAAVLLALAFIRTVLRGDRFTAIGMARVLAAAGLMVLAALGSVLPVTVVAWAAAVVTALSLLYINAARPPLAPNEEIHA